MDPLEFTEEEVETEEDPFALDDSADDESDPIEPISFTQEDTSIQPASYSAEDVKSLVIEEAKRQGVPPSLALSVADQESGFNVNARGAAGEIGVMQLMPAAAQEMGVNREDVRDNIKGGVGYLAKQMQATGGVPEAALANYNAGPGAATKARETGTSYPSSTNDYISSISSKRSKYTQFDDPEYQLQAPSQAATLLGEENEPEIEGESGTAKDFANKLLPFTSSPEFSTMPLTDKLRTFGELYNSKQWDKDSYEVLKQVSSLAYDAADPDELPNLKDIVGVPPLLESGVNPDTELAKWGNEARQKIFDSGVSPAVFGKQLDEYIDTASNREKDAFIARNRGMVGNAANTVGNWTRDVAKGVVSGVAKPVAGITRLAGASETANFIEDKPIELLGDPDKDYLYETDDNGYIKMNADGSPKMRWQSQIAQTVGSVGVLLSGGAALKAAGAGAGTLFTTFFGVNTFSKANDSFRLVEETTGSKEKAYKAAVASLPAAVVDTIGDMFVSSKVFAPYLSGLSRYEKIQYAAKQFARGTTAIGVTSGASDVVQQVGEISQTGGEYDPNRTAQQVIGGGLSGGIVTGVTETFSAASAKQKAIAKNSADIKTAALEVEALRESPFNEFTTRLKPEHIPLEQRERLGINVAEGPDGNAVITRAKDVDLPPGTPEELPTTLEAIQRLETPEEIIALQQERNVLATKQKDGTLTEPETERLTALNESLDGIDNPKHINNIKAFESQVREALDVDPSALPVRWNSGTNKWEHFETGDTGTFLKDVLYPRIPKESVYEKDFSDLSNVRLLDEDALVYNPEEIAAQENALLENTQTLEQDINSTREEFVQRKAFYQQQKKQLAATEQQNRKLAKERQSLTADKESTNKSISEIEGQLKALPALDESPVSEPVAAKKTADLTTELESTKAKILKLQNKAANLKTKAAKDKAKVDLNAARTRERDIRAELLNLRKDVRSEKENQSLADARTKNNEKRTKLENELNALRATQKELEGKQIAADTPLPKLEDADKALKDTQNRGRDLQGKLKEAKQKLAEFQKTKVAGERNLSRDKAKLDKVREKGVGAVITADKKSEIIIPTGLTPEAKQQVVAHELGHVLSDKITLPENVEQSVEKSLKGLETSEKVLTVADAAEKILLPEVRKTTKLPPGATLAELDKPSKNAITSKREYLANQIGAEILRREGVDTAGMDINPELALYLKTVDLPQTKKLIAAPEEPVAAADGNIPPPTEPPSKPPTVPPSEPSLTGKTGEEGETAFSQRIREEAPEQDPVKYPKRSRAVSREEITDFVYKNDHDTVVNDIKNETGAIAEALKPLTSQILLEKASNDYDANPTAANAKKFEEAYALRAANPSEKAQAISLLVGSYNNPTFAGFVQNVTKILQDTLGSDFKGIPEYALKELKVLYDEAKKLGLRPGSARDDYVNAGVAKLLQSQGINQREWVQAFIRTNLLSGVGTQTINAVGGLWAGPIFTMLRHPSLAPLTIKAMFGTGLKVGIADAKRVLAGKQVALLLRNIGEPSPLLIQDNSTPLRAIQSFYNRYGLGLFRAMSAVDAMNRRMASEGYMAQESYKVLKKLYGNDPGKFTAEASKLYFNKDTLNNAITGAKDEALTKGVKLSDADATVRAYERLKQEGFAAEPYAHILEKASDWADLVSLRGKLSNPLLQAANEAYANFAKRHKYLGTAATTAIPFARAILALADLTVDFVPGAESMKWAERKGITRNRDLSEAQKIKALDRHAMESERAVAGRKAGALLAGGLLAGVLSESIEITGDAEEVLDRDPARGESPIGKPAKGREGFAESEQTGVPPFTIRIKGTDIGIKYKDLPGLNVIAYGVYQAKKAMDAGASPLAAAANFYRGALNQLTNVSLFDPYKRFYQDMMNPNTPPAELFGKLGTATANLAKQNVNMFIPFSGLLKDIKKIYDETPEESNQPFLNAAFKDIPIASEIFGSKPALNVFGEPKQRTDLERVPGAARLISQVKDFDDPVAKAMQQKGIIVPENPRTITFNDSDFSSKQSQSTFVASRSERLGKALSNAFTPDEWYEFIKTTGPKIKGVVKDIVSSDMDTKQAQQMLIKRVDRIRDTAKKNFIRTGKF